MLSTTKLSGSMGVWKPCKPFQVMFLTVHFNLDGTCCALLMYSLDCNTSSLRNEDEILEIINQSVAEDNKRDQLTASPWTMTVRTLFSMTLGSTLNVEATLVSLPGPPVALAYTVPEEHVSQLI